MNTHVRRIAVLGMMTSLAMVLSWVERIVPLPVPIPGLKLGLPNLVTLYVLYHMGAGSAAAVMAVRSVLTALLFASPTGLLFSLTGGLFALLAMWCFKKNQSVSVFGVSVSGAAAHHIGQVSAAVLLLQTPGLFSYLTLLLPASIPTGLLIAMLYCLLDRKVCKP